VNVEFFAVCVVAWQCATMWRQSKIEQRLDALERDRRG
jgi:hypothetical protein